MVVAHSIRALLFVCDVFGLYTFSRHRYGSVTQSGKFSGLHEEGDLSGIDVSSGSPRSRGGPTPTNSATGYIVTPNNRHHLQQQQRPGSFASQSVILQPAPSPSSLRARTSGCTSTNEINVDPSSVSSQELKPATGIQGEPPPPPLGDKSLNSPFIRSYWGR